VTVDPPGNKENVLMFSPNRVSVAETKEGEIRKRKQIARHNGRIFLKAVVFFIKFIS
jgi:hypothetical protein